MHHPSGCGTVVVASVQRRYAEVHFHAFFLEGALVVLADFIKVAAQVTYLSSS